MKFFKIFIISLGILLTVDNLSVAFSQNRIAIIEDEKVKLLEFDKDKKKYFQIWESVPIREKILFSKDFKEPLILDFDNDGKNELISMDEFGLFVWGKYGKYPEYYGFQEAYMMERNTQLLIFDIDDDSINEVITQGPYINNFRTITVWKINNGLLKKSDSINCNSMVIFLQIFKIFLSFKTYII